jgi:gluconate 2-dehydrogenase alpha chain
VEAGDQGVVPAFFYYEVQGACMSYRSHYLDLDPTYKDAFGRPLLRMTFDWNENEIKASQFLVGKALDMCKTLKPKALSGDAKQTGSHYNVTHYQSTHTCGGAIMGADPKFVRAQPLSAVVGRSQCLRPGRQRFPTEQWVQPHGYGRRADLLGREGHS